MAASTTDAPIHRALTLHCWLEGLATGAECTGGVWLSSPLCGAGVTLEKQKSLPGLLLGWVLVRSTLEGVLPTEMVWMGQVHRRTPGLCVWC